jgi:hypothetical protein
MPLLEPRSLADLAQLEHLISQLVRQFPLDGILLALRRASAARKGVMAYPQPFVVAAAARFAVKYGRPGPSGPSAGGAIHANDLAPILRLSQIHALADPIGWDNSVPRSPLSIMLRHVGNQFPYMVSAAGKWGRAQVMYEELPRELEVLRGVPSFDFASKFQELVGVSVPEFIDVCYLAFSAAASTNHLGFSRDYFQQARRGGIRIGDDDVVQPVLDHIAADAATHAKMAAEYQQPDRRFAAYDFSPLMPYPLIRPWPRTHSETMASDRMLAPIPELITFRLSTGIYYHMRQAFKGTFDQYFGHLLEAYVGRLFKTFMPSHRLFSERDLRRSYPERAGKVPDWVLLDGETAVLVECKASRIHRLTYAQGEEREIRKNIRDVLGGLRQLYEFRRAVMQRAPGLESLHGCNRFIPIIVTWEPLHLSNSVYFKELVRLDLGPPVNQMDWGVLSLDQLEWLQLYLAGGLGVADMFLRAMTEDYNKAIDWAHSITKRTYADSWLCHKEDELHHRIGVPPFLGNAP